MDATTPGLPLPRLCLSRRRQSRTRITHLSSIFDFILVDISARRFRYAFECGATTTIVGSWAEGEPPIRLIHGGEELVIAVGRISGGTARLLFEGPRSFQIERDDARRGPREAESRDSGPVRDPSPEIISGEALTEVILSHQN